MGAAATPDSPDEFWDELDFQLDLMEDQRQRLLKARGIDLAALCESNRHRYVDTIDLQPVRGTDRLAAF